jgi:hypothetical protein
VNSLLEYYTFIRSYIDTELLIIILAGLFYTLLFYVKELLLKTIKVRNKNVKEENKQENESY